MQNARVSAFVTFHFRLLNMQFLCRVLRNLAGFEVGRMHVTIVTSTDDTVQVALLHRLCLNYFDRSDFTIAAFIGCQPGVMLTWKHKPLLREAAAHDFTHFIYVEDDIGLSSHNFRYFFEYADVLGENGLIPGLLRTEFADGTLRAVDAGHSTRNFPSLEVSGQTFASPSSPYCGCFIMDRRHISEYLNSRSFDFDLSSEVSAWGIPERAAMGLCWESPPAGFRHRYVLPINPDDFRVHACCQLPHMPNKYAPIAAEQWAKLPVELVFVP